MDRKNSPALRALLRHPQPMRRAIELAWDSFRAGNLGIGAVITDHSGTELSTGRNCLLYGSDDEPLGNTSLAHAETNALAKLGYREHFGNDYVLWTTLQPCVQCLGAITLSPVRHVNVLAPDPLFRGIEGLRALLPESVARFPTVRELVPDEWSTFTLLLRTMRGLTEGSSPRGWNEGLPNVALLGAELVESGRVHALTRHERPADAAAIVWDDLTQAVSDAETLAAITAPITLPGSPT